MPNHYAYEVNCACKFSCPLPSYIYVPYSKNFGSKKFWQNDTFYIGKKTLANPGLTAYFSAHCIELRKLVNAAHDTRSTIVKIRSWLFIARRIKAQNLYTSLIPAKAAHTLMHGIEHSDRLSISATHKCVNILFDLVCALYNP